MMMNRRQTTFDGDEVIVTYRETTWNEVRVNRDAALAESDWRAVKDRVLPNAWKSFRSFLRDLPQNFDSANDAADAWAAYDIPE